MDALLDQIKQFAANADAAARHQIAHKLRGLASEIETPRETMMRYSYLVCGF
jgi:hypothetical protein